MTQRRAKEAPDYVVDDSHGAMLNTNQKALDAYKKQRRQVQQMNALAGRVDAIEHKLDGIFNMLNLLLKATNNDGPRAQ